MMYSCTAQSRTTAELATEWPLEEPDALVTTGCPHLGVRRYLFAPVPSWVHPAGALIAGATADDLLLRDPSNLLVEMSSPDSSFGEALAAFGRRRCYANLRGDFMVPFGSAAIETGPWGCGIRDAQHARAFARSAGVRYSDEAVLDGMRDGIAVIRETRPVAPGRMRSPRRRRQSEWIDDDDFDPSWARTAGPEDSMRTGLHAHGWSKVAVSFHSATTLSPLAHNRLVALRRDGWKQAISESLERTQEGTFVMTDCAEWLTQRAAPA